MQGGLARLDLVTREEFDTQARVLAKTREKLERLEARVNELLLPAIPNRKIDVQSTLFPGQETAYGAALLALDHVPVSELRGPK